MRKRGKVRWLKDLKFNPGLYVEGERGTYGMRSAVGYKIPHAGTEENLFELCRTSISLLIIYRSRHRFGYFGPVSR